MESVFYILCIFANILFLPSSFDKPCDNAFCHFIVVVDAGHHKSDLIFLSRKCGHIAGMCHGIDSDIKADKIGSLIDFRNDPCIFSLFMAFPEVIFIDIGCRTLCIHFYNDLVNRASRIYQL